MSATFSKRFAFLFDRTDAINVAVFRICFGLLMLWEMIYFIRLDFVKIFLTGPQILFPYEPVSFLAPLSGPVMQLLIAAMALSCVLIMIGRLYRPAMIVLFVGFTYIFLLDKAYYNNHLYLLCLIAGMMCWIPADKVLAWNQRYGEGDRYLPRWMLLLLQIQIVIVYFYGGIAKLNPDWLFHSQPVQLMVEAKAADTGWESLLTSTVFIGFITYGGVLFDLLVGIGLFVRKIRPFAIAAAVLFNLTNAWLFDDINIFPYFMLSALLLFVDPEWIRNQIGKIWKKRSSGKKKKPTQPVPDGFSWHQPTVIILLVFLTLQLVLPFRHFLIAGNTDWTGEGQRFSWRMKIQQRKMEKLEFMIFDYGARKQVPVDLKVMAAYGLNRDQFVQMVQDPKMVVRFARFLAEDYRKRNRPTGKVEVKANVEVAFNGRKPQRLIDPEIDLASQPVDLLKHNEWILPLVSDP